MNRREFVKTILGSSVTVFTVSRLGFGATSRNVLAGFPESYRDIRDLLMWAPYEAFLPDETNPVIEDPSDGTETGTLTAAQIQTGQEITLQYWHEHGGIYHKFTVTADQLASLKAGKPTVFTIPTTVVEDHYHFTIIDPSKPAA